jgi:glycosyltransferase involved in cell wall biosynthesis
MLPVYITGDWHHKNKNGLQLVKEISIRPWNGERDGIIFTNELRMDIVNHYDKVIMGPGIDLKQGIDYFKSYQGEKKIIFNALSSWNKNLFDRYASHPKITYITLPFPVEVEKFQPAEKRKQFFIYFKNVHSSRLRVILDMIKRLPEQFQDYEYNIFRYGSYQENEYLEYIQSSQFGIWIGSHESQGFALEEALSCNCPLFVYNITSMKDECLHDTTYPWGHIVEDLPATAASYFDETCGTIYHEGESIDDAMLFFMKSLNQFTPREFILRYLTTSSFIENLNQIMKDTT